MNNYINKGLLSLLFSMSLITNSYAEKRNIDGAETKENFMINAYKSISERSGNIFAIPKKYNITTKNLSTTTFYNQ